MKRLSEQELCRLRSDAARADNESRQANEKVHAMQNELFAAHDKIERFMLQRNWNQGRPKSSKSSLTFV
jgi:hypothetical protein